MVVTNVTKEFAELIGSALLSDGSLPAHTWPNSYPLFYWDKEHNVLCPACANRNDEYSSPLEGVDINWEDDNFSCEHCGKQIESACFEKALEAIRIGSKEVY